MKLNRPQVAFLWSCTSGYDVDFPVRLHYAIQKPRLQTTSVFCCWNKKWFQMWVSVKVDIRGTTSVCCSLGVHTSEGQIHIRSSYLQPPHSFIHVGQLALIHRLNPKYSQRVTKSLLVILCFLLKVSFTLSEISWQQDHRWFYTRHSNTWPKFSICMVLIERKKWPFFLSTVLKSCILSYTL